MWIVYLAIPLGSGLMCYRFTQVLLAYLQGRALPGHHYGDPGEVPE